MRKIDFQVVALFDYCYPVLTVRHWYETNHNKLTPTNVLNDFMKQKIGQWEADALSEALHLEDNLTKLKKNNPGICILIMN
jgi:hypothetical protein